MSLTEQLQNYEKAYEQLEVRVSEQEILLSELKVGCIDIKMLVSSTIKGVEENDVDKSIRNCCLASKKIEELIKRIK